MTPIVAFVLGLLIGWLVEWIIDWVYWRRRQQELIDSVQKCKQNLTSLETELSASQQEFQTLQAKNSQLEQERAQLEARVQQSQTDREIPRVETVVPQRVIPDNLQVIKGIGPVIADLLNQNGIYTYEQLAAQTSAYLRDILGDVIQRLSDEDSLIEQARQLARYKQDHGTGGQ